MSRTSLALSFSIATMCWFPPTTAIGQNLTEEKVTAIASPMVKNKVVDGLSIGYLEGDSYGMVHLGSASRSGTKANNLTVYEIGSISKVFTGMLLADAVVRGEIELDATASIDNAAGIRLPSRDDRSIKWVDLSTHRSGLPRLPGNFKPASMKNPYREYDATKAASECANFRLPRKPGDKQEYSNFAVSILGYLVAENANTTYQNLLQERIAKPLGMKDCTVDLTSDQKKRFAVPHDQVGSPTLEWSFADMPGAGGVHATMFDMMRFAKAQLNPPPGKLGEAIELAWEKHSDADASGSATGLGWMIHGDGETRWHNGGTGGTRTAMFINRRIKSAVIVLCNTSVGNEIDQLAAQLLQVAAGIEPQAKQSRGDMANGGTDETSNDKGAKHRARLVGRYRMRNFIYDIEDRQGHLMAKLSDQQFNEVFPDSPTKWSYRGLDAMLEFKLGRNGRATSVTLHQNGIKQTFRRVGK